MASSFYKPKDTWYVKRLRKRLARVSTTTTNPLPRRTITAQPLTTNLSDPIEHHSKPVAAAQATAVLAEDMLKLAVKAPILFFYNVANGFNNLPSYIFHDDTVRRRDNITSLPSGLKVAGKSLVFGIYDGFTGLVTQAYRNAKKGKANDGLKGAVAGTGKGVGKGLGGLMFKPLGGVFGTLGYSLKGVEKQVWRRKEREIEAVIIKVRIQESVRDFNNASLEERNEM